MTLEFTQKVGDELQCSVCYNMIMDPRVLQCPHTFCLHCLERSHTARLRLHRVPGASPVREDEFECPTCRQITHLPDPDPMQPTRGRIASLSTNLPLKNVARLLAEREANRRPVPHSICEVHSTQQLSVALDNYCETCGELVCYKCMHCPPHSSHKETIHLAADVLQDRAGALRALAEDIATKASSVKEVQEAVQERLVKSRDVVISTIKSSHEKKLALLQKRVDGLLAAVKDSTESRLAALTQSLQKMEEANNFASQTDSSIEQMVADKDLGILAKETSLLQELRTHQQVVQEESERLSGSEVKLDLVLRFEEDSNFDHYLSTFGHLMECQHERDPSRSYPVLRVKHELKIAHDGETYMYAAPTAHAGLPPRLEYGMLPPGMPHYQTPLWEESQTSTRHLSSLTSSLKSPEKSYYDLPPDASPGNRELNDDDIYEDMSNLLKFPPVARTVRRPRHDCLPPIPTHTGRLSHGKAGQPTWMLASHPPLLPLRQPKTSLIKPIQIIENDQFMPESTIDVCPSGVSCTGTYNNIIITDTSNHCLRVVDRNGHFVTKIGRRGGERGCFNMPVALAISSDNFYYVVDQGNARIQKFNLHGSIELILGEKKGRQLLKKPQGIAVHQVTGDVYVADSNKKRIYVYQSDGTYVHTIGKKEKGISFNCPVAVAISKSDQLLVVDRSSQANGRHCVWCIRQPEMELIRKIGEGVLENPSGIAVAEDGTILVTELDSGSICVFSHTGDPIHRFGQMGADPGMFNLPCGVCINSKGQVVIADKGNHRVQIFSVKDILGKD